MWMRLLSDYDYKPTAASTVAYKAGCIYNAPRLAVEAALAAGRAIGLRKTRKDEEPQPWPSEAEPAR